MPQLQVKKITELNDERINSFLEAHYETAMFLLSNMSEHGVSLGMHPNSGNFFSIDKGRDIEAVFCLTRRGNILLQTLSNTYSQQLSQLVIGSCRKENVKIRGILGAWNTSSAMWQDLRKENLVEKENYLSKEILYSKHQNFYDPSTKEFIRILKEDDFASWSVMRKAFMEEAGMNNSLSDEEFKQDLLSLAAAQRFVGLFDKNDLIGTAGLNAKIKSIGQVGSVYIKPFYRKRGLAKTMMLAMEKTMMNLHDIDKFILFTSEDNIAAQSLYESISYQKIGHYGIILA